MMPTYVPAEWAPTKMTAHQYKTRRAHLVAQQEAAQKIEAAFAEAFAGPAAHPSLSLFEGVGTAWNGAHDLVEALGWEIHHLDREWANRKVDPYQRFLVSNNID